MSLFYKIKHFLTSTREQFFVNQFSKGGNRILSVTRTRDFKKFFWNQFIERDDFRVFIYKFSKDLIRGNVSGDISTMSGDIKCGNVGGSAKTTSGDIRKN